jgi:hypothetical protein
MAMDCGEIEGSSGSRGGSLAGARLRAALAGGAAVAIVLAALGAADAAVQSKPPHAKREQAKKEPTPKPLDLPLIEVSISKQQLTLYENGAPVAHSPVSTGMAGHSTPTGIFSVIGKEIFHRSNIYSGAPMPFMQRITWSGVAMHAGVLPGYPASHGCIRLPHDFAVRLYGLTRMGARVLVMPHEVAPAPFEHARLFTRPKPATDKVSAATPPADARDTKPAPAVRTAESHTPVMSDAADTAAHALSGLAKPKPAEAAAPTPAEVVKARTPAPAEAAAPTPAEVVKARTPAPAEAAAPTPAEVVKARTPAPAETAASEPLAEGLKSAATTAATEASQAVEAAKTDDPKYSAAAGPNGEPTTGAVVVKPVAVTAPQPIEVRKSFEPVTGPSQGTQTFQPVPTPPAAQPVQAAPAVVPAPPAPAQAAQPAPAPEAKPAPAATAAADELYGPERPMRPGPITVFVSKKEGKVFVRKGFQPVFSWPVKFAHPELPLGTHLYTALDANPDGVSYRWQVVSVPVDTTKKAEKHVSRDKKGRRIETMVQPAVALPAATAAEALERIDIPPVALTRISALMSKGASLIISDQGLGGETGTETDFIVLTR